MTHKPVHVRSGFEKALIILGAGVLVSVLFILVFLLQPAYATSAETLAFSKEAVAQQQKIEEELRAYYQAGEYCSIDRPHNV
jgi:cell division protein FtsL